MITLVIIFEEGEDYYSGPKLLPDHIKDFKKMLEIAQNDNDCLCFADAVHKAGLPISSVNKAAKKHEELANIKEDIRAVIIRRVNRNALKNKFSAAASIFRLKQLGEKDQSYRDHTTDGESFNNTISVEIVKNNDQDEED